MKRHAVRRISFSALIAAIYATLTLATGFMSYGLIQFRIAEALCILPFFFPFTTYGLFAGCLLANLVSPAGPADVVFGSLATLLCCLCVAAIGKQGKAQGWGRCIAACLMPVLWNGVIVGLLLTFMGTDTVNSAPFWLLFVGNAISVAFGEAVVMFVIGLPLLRWLPGSRFFEMLRKGLDNAE